MSSVKFTNKTLNHLHIYINIWQSRFRKLCGENCKRSMATFPMVGQSYILSGTKHIWQKPNNSSYIKHTDAATKMGYLMSLKNTFELLCKKCLCKTQKHTSNLYILEIYFVNGFANLNWPTFHTLLSLAWEKHQDFNNSQEIDYCLKSFHWVSASREQKGKPMLSKILGEFHVDRQRILPNS